MILVIFCTLIIYVIFFQKIEGFTIFGQDINVKDQNYGPHTGPFGFQKCRSISACTLNM